MPPRMPPLQARTGTATRKRTACEQEERELVGRRERLGKLTAAELTALNAYCARALDDPGSVHGSYS